MFSVARTLFETGTVTGNDFEIPAGIEAEENDIRFGVVASAHSQQFGPGFSGVFQQQAFLRMFKILPFLFRDRHFFVRFFGILHIAP